ncbi:unnamed protein product, partial [Discosporangium mesarthrocarpum]
GERGTGDRIRTGMGAIASGAVHGRGSAEKGLELGQGQRSMGERRMAGGSRDRRQGRGRAMHKRGGAVLTDKPRIVGVERQSAKGDKVEGEETGAAGGATREAEGLVAEGVVDSVGESSGRG